MRKTCTKCGIEKDIDEFVTRNALISGKAARCKKCASAVTVILNKKDLEKQKIRNKKWRDTHQEHIKDARRLYGISHPEAGTNSSRKWRANNPEKALAAINKAAAIRLSTMKGRLSCRIASAMRLTLKNGSKGKQHWEDIVGYTVEQLMNHLESKFTPEMSWENYGTYWSIDHKIPVAAFNFERPNDIDFRVCWSIKNLQPMEKLANIRKSDKIDRPHQPSLAIAV